jgi:excisionase family DNA binding protein
MKAKKSENNHGHMRGLLSWPPSGDPVCLTVSVEEAGRILGISRGAAYTHARDGSLPTIRLGKRLLVPKAALHQMLASAAS